MTAPTGLCAVYPKPQPLESPPEISESEPIAVDDSILARVRTGDWLDAQMFPPMRWAVPGVFPEGFGLLTGSPKVGKSWAAFGVALAVASGGTAFGCLSVGDPRPALLLALEDGDRRLQGRARHLLGDGQPIPPNLHYLTRANPREVLEVVEAWLACHVNSTPLVVLDTLGRVMPLALPGEGAYARDYRVGSHLKGIVDAHSGACLMVVHHTRKATAEDWMDSTSGTQGLNGSADWTATLTRPRSETTGLLRITGRDVAEAEYSISTDSGRWTLDGGSLDTAACIAGERKAAAGLGDRSAELIAFVNRSTRPVTPLQAKEALDMPDARRYLARLAEAGRLAKTGRGLYTGIPTVPMSHSDGTLSH